MGPLLSNELAMPPEDSVGSDERSNFGEGASSKGLASNRESAALIVGQSKSLATELLLQDTVLFSEILDDRILLSGDPARHCSDAKGAAEHAAVNNKIDAINAGN